MASISNSLAMLRECFTLDATTHHVTILVPPIDNDCDGSPSELLDWTGEPEIDQPCTLTFSAGREWLASAGLASLLVGGHGKKRKTEVAVAGESGKRLRIRRFGHPPPPRSALSYSILSLYMAVNMLASPEAFLNQVVLHSMSAKKWLAKQLSITNWIYYRKRLQTGASRRPCIWMVTGIQFITNACVSNTVSHSSNTHEGITIPMPDPVAAAVMLPVPTGKDGLDFKIETSNFQGTQSQYQHANERVWAAQFSPLDVKYHKDTDVAEDDIVDPPLDKWITLREPADLGASGIRQGGVQGKGQSLDKFAEIRGLDDQHVHELEEGDALLDAMLDVDWSLLDDYLEEMDPEHDLET